MRWAQTATIRPHRCAAIPFVGNHNAKRGFIDTGSELDQEHVYVSIEAVEEMARLCEWQPPHVVAELQQLASLQKQMIARLEAENVELQARFDAIDVLGSAGFTARRKPGRKKEEGAVA